jgi:hypothetical protein
MSVLVNTSSSLMESSKFTQLLSTWRYGFCTIQHNYITIDSFSIRHVVMLLRMLTIEGFGAKHWFHGVFCVLCCISNAVLFFISLVKAVRWVRSCISMQQSAEFLSTFQSVSLFTISIVYLLQKMLKFLRAFWHLLLSSLIGRFAALPTSVYYISAAGLWNFVQVSFSTAAFAFYVILYRRHTF